jgi:uncharacterized protein YdeI (YjbR/CyaY-like superfamily)
MNPNVDWFFVKATPWQPHYAELRHILLQTNLNEELKWGCPCYTHNGRNIVLMHGFRNYCALLFPKGALLPDPGPLLTQQTPNVRSARQLRFQTLADIKRHRAFILSCVNSAITLEQNGTKLAPRPVAEFPIPAELSSAFSAEPGFAQAFHNLTPGRKRAWLLHFSAARQSATRSARIERSASVILAGLGPNEKPR